MKILRKIFKNILLVIVMFASLMIATASNIKPVVAASVPDTTTITTTTINKIKTKSHPYILYEGTEVNELREKIKSGYSQMAFKYVETTAKKYLNASISVSSNSAGIIGRQLQSYVAYLSTYGMLTGESKYYDKAISLVMTAVNSGSVDIYKGINDALCISDFGYAYALAYDWLYNYMDSSQRNILKSEMEEIGNWLFTNSKLLNTWGSEEERRKAWNWNAVTHGALGMIAVSLAKDVSHADWLKLAINRMKGYYSYAVDSTGASMEGLHYIGYALNTLAVLDDTIYNMSNVELLDYYLPMQKIPEWSMWMTAPYGNEQAAINQGTKLDNYAATYYIINRYSQSNNLWGWEKTYNINSTGFVSDYAGNGWNAPAIIFYEDKNLKPVKPNEYELMVNTYEKGLIIGKDGLNSNSSMFTFTSGKGYAGCWNHPDNNSFTFFANGESFVIDLGANFKKSSQHNVVLVDNKEMLYEGGSSMVEGHILTNKKLSNDAWYIKADNSDCYNDSVLTTSTRQFIYKGGNTPYIIAFDYVYSGTNSHSFTTNFYTDKESNIEIINSSKAKITGANNGGICYVMVYSDGGASLSKISDGTTLAIKTTNNAITHKQATLFIPQNSMGIEPIITWNNANGKIEVTIKHIYSKYETVDKYVFSSDADVVMTSSTNCVHNPIRVTGVEATCTSKGIIEHYKCSNCNKTFLDYKCSSQVYNIELPMQDHEYSEWYDEIPPTATSKGVKGYYYCEGCEEFFDRDYQIIDDLSIPKIKNNHASVGCGGSIISSIYSLVGLLSLTIFVYRIKRKQ